MVREQGMGEGGHLRGVSGRLVKSSCECHLETVHVGNCLQTVVVGGTTIATSVCCVSYALPSPGVKHY